MSTSNSTTFEDVRIGVRLKVSALWIAMLFLFAYGDIFGFFAPRRIEEVIAGEISGIEIMTPDIVPQGHPSRPTNW